MSAREEARNSGVSDVGLICHSSIGKFSAVYRRSLQPRSLHLFPGLLFLLQRYAVLITAIRFISVLLQLTNVKNQRFHRFVQTAYRWLIRVASKLQSPFLLGVRLYWGWQFFLTGWGKLLNLERTSDFFASLHIPVPTLSAFTNASLECIGGLLLLLGLGSRLIALPLIASMILAYLTADFDRVQAIFSDPNRFVTADPFLFLLASLIILIFGPGIFSLDAVIKRRLADRQAKMGEPPRV